MKAQYGEPWSFSERNRRFDITAAVPGDPRSSEHIGIMFSGGEAKRAIACVNTLAGIPDSALDKVRELVEAWKVWHTTSERGSALRFDAHDSVFSKAAALGALLAKESK